jgi:hypothetical protein
VDIPNEEDISSLLVSPCLPVTSVLQFFREEGRKVEKGWKGEEGKGKRKEMYRFLKN